MDLPKGRLPDKVRKTCSMKAVCSFLMSSARPLSAAKGYGGDWGCKKDFKGFQITTGQNESSNTT